MQGSRLRSAYCYCCTAWPAALRGLCSKAEKTKTLAQWETLFIIIFIAHFLPYSQVFLDSPVIVNGVSVRWRGSVNLEKLDGVGGFRFDEDSSRVEDMAMQQQVDGYKHALRDWEDQQAR